MQLMPHHCLMKSLNPLKGRGLWAQGVKSFYRKNFTVIDPVQYVLNAQEKNIHLFMLERSEVLQTLQRSNEQEGHNSSFQDGEYFKGNKLLTGRSVRDRQMMPMPRMEL